VDEPIQELEVAGDLLQQRAEPETAGTGAVDDLLKRMTAKERYVAAGVVVATAASCAGGWGGGAVRGSSSAQSQKQRVPWPWMTC
jgi:hypothetical protein